MPSTSDWLSRGGRLSEAYPLVFRYAAVSVRRVAIFLGLGAVFLTAVPQASARAYRDCDAPASNPFSYKLKMSTRHRSGVSCGLARVTARLATQTIDFRSYRRRGVRVRNGFVCRHRRLPLDAERIDCWRRSSHVWFFVSFMG